MEMFGQPADSATVFAVWRAWVEIPSGDLLPAARALSHNPDREFTYVLPVNIPVRNERPQTATGFTILHVDPGPMDSRLGAEASAESRTVVTATDAETVKINIRLARLHAHPYPLSQRELGDAVEVAREHVSRWERTSSSARTPSMSALRRIAKATGRDVAWFFEPHNEDDL